MRTKYSRLFNISYEEDEVVALPEEDSGSDVDVTDAIENEEAANEVAEQQEVLDEQAETVEESIEVAEELQEQVDEQEAILEQKPEEITPEVVQTAQEAFQIQLARLGMSYEEIALQRISVESMVSNPVEAFRVSTEGIKETLKKIWEKIKSVVRTIINTLGNVWAKIKTFFQKLFYNNKKVLEKIKEIKANNKGMSFNISADMKAKILKQCSGALLYTGGDMSAQNLTNLGRALISCEVYNFDKEGKMAEIYKDRKAVYTTVMAKTIKSGNDANGIIIGLAGNGISYAPLNDDNTFTDDGIKQLKITEWRDADNLKLTGMFSNIDELEKQYSAFLKSFASDTVMKKCENDSSKAASKVNDNITKILNNLGKSDDSVMSGEKEKIARKSVNIQLQIIRAVPSNYIKFVSSINNAVNTVLSGSFNKAGGEEKAQEAK